MWLSCQKVVVNIMKHLVIKFFWALFWLIFGLLIAHNHHITEPIKIAITMMASLLIADWVKQAIKKIAAHVLT